MPNQEVADQFQDFQKRLSHFEQMVDSRFGEGTMEKAKEQASTADLEALQTFMEQSLDLVNRIVDAIKKELATDSVEVQNLLQKHYELSTKFQPMTKETYLLSREILRDAPEFYAVLHPKLPEFLYSAMGVYAENHSFDQ